MSLFINNIVSLDINLYKWHMLYYYFTPCFKKKLLMFYILTCVNTLKKQQLIFIDVECVRYCSVTYFIFIKLLKGKYYCFYFTKEETLAHRLIICPQSDGWLSGEAVTKPTGWGLESLFSATAILSRKWFKWSLVFLLRICYNLLWQPYFSYFQKFVNTVL